MGITGIGLLKGDDMADPNSVYERNRKAAEEAPERDRQREEERTAAREKHNSLRTPSSTASKSDPEA